jgi:hypothetical protein
MQNCRTGFRWLQGLVRRYVLDLTISQISFCSNNKLIFVSGVDHFEILPFTTDIESFKSFVMKIYATGGGDAPEDVVCGIDRAVSLEWPSNSGSRVLFHLGDSPPHGRPKYHDSEDDYPTGH